MARHEPQDVYHLVVREFEVSDTHVFNRPEAGRAGDGARL